MVLDQQVKTLCEKQVNKIIIFSVSHPGDEHEARPDGVLL